MGTISIISAIAAVILLYCSIIITNLKGFKKGRIFLFIALIPAVVSFVCKTNEVNTAFQAIYILASIYPVLGAFGIFSKKEDDKKFGLVNLIALIVCILAMILSGMKWSNNSSDYSGKKCIFCEKRTATHGNYCDPCYDAIHPD